MNVDQLHDNCLLRSLTDAQFRKSISALNERFTRGRNAISGYGDDPALVSAYAAFYLPTNMKKLAFVLSQIRALPISLEAPLEVVDFGCGPGTYGFALYEYLRSLEENGAATVSARFRFVDPAPLMLRQAQKIQEIMYPEMTADFCNGLPGTRTGTQRLVLLGNVINEMGIDGFDAMFFGVNADLLICIEPGTRESFGAMAAVRRRVVDAGYRVLYPCSASSECPLSRGGDDWCHQVQKASLEPTVARLGQLAALDRTVMPFIGHVYAKSMDTDIAESEPLCANAHRGVLFRLKTHSKHAFFWEVCMPTGDGLQLKKVELPKRGLSRPEQKALERVSAGQRIAFEVEKELGNGALRIRNVTCTRG